MAVSHTIEEVKELLSNYDLELMDTEYKSGMTMNVICVNRHSYSTNLSSIKNYKCCKRCKNLEPYFKVKKILENQEFKLLTKEEDFINTKTKLVVMCNNGHVYYPLLHNVIKGQGCNKCKFNKLREHHRTKEEDAIKIFTDNNYRFISFIGEYTNNSTRAVVECPKNHRYDTSILNFSAGYRCNECGINRTRGRNNYLWNGGLKSLAKHVRDNLSIWRQDTLKKYNYTCFVSSKTGALHVHHKNNFSVILRNTLNEIGLGLYDSYGEYTDKELELIINTIKKQHYDNDIGIPMHPEIHMLFHQIYGKKNNTMEQVIEFKKNYLDGKYQELNL